MRRKVITLPAAELDISEAYFYFEQKREGLGEVFLARIGDSYDRIANAPEAYALISNLGIRKARLRQFPFIVGYFMENDVVIILGVLHGSRNPEAWRSRLR
jgi:plasmid stabilization system protein ParE